MVSEIYCPDSTCPRPQSLIHENINDSPKFPRSYPPFIYHIYADIDYMDLFSLIRQETRLHESYIHELFDFGAIYLQSKPSRAEVPVRSVNSIPMDRQSDGSIPVFQGMYCRVHVNPRRYFGGYDISWANRVTSSLLMPDIVIVDKPYDLPMTPTVDNTRENLSRHLDEYFTTIHASK